MSIVEFSKEEKEFIVKDIQNFFSKELDQEIEQFDSIYLLDFFSDNIGPYYYNRGLFDAQAILEKRMDNIKEAISELEKNNRVRAVSVFTNCQQ